MKNMDKKAIGLIVVFLLLIGAFLYRVEITHAIGAVLRSGANVSTGEFAMTTNASSSLPNFFQNGTGTTTLTFVSDNFTSLTMYLQVFASTTNVISPLNIRLQASDDNTNFFDYDPTILEGSSFRNALGTTTIALASTTVAYSYQPSTRGATSTKVVNVNLLPARYTRVIFTVASSTPTVGGAPFYRDGMSLWANMVGQIEGGR